MGYNRRFGAQARTKRGPTGNRLEGPVGKIVEGVSELMASSRDLLRARAMEAGIPGSATEVMTNESLINVIVTLAQSRAEREMGLISRVHELRSMERLALWKVGMDAGIGRGRASYMGRDDLLRGVVKLELGDEGLDILERGLEPPKVSVDDIPRNISVPVEELWPNIARRVRETSLRPAAKKKRKNPRESLSPGEKWAEPRSRPGKDAARDRLVDAATGVEPRGDLGVVRVVSLPSASWRFEQEMVRRGMVLHVDAWEWLSREFPKVVNGFPWSAEMTIDEAKEAYWIPGGGHDPLTPTAHLRFGDVFDAIAETGGIETDITWLDLCGTIRKPEWAPLMQAQMDATKGIFCLTFLKGRWQGAVNDEQKRLGGYRAWVLEHLGEPDEWVEYCDTTPMVQAMWRMDEAEDRDGPRRGDDGGRPGRPPELSAPGSQGEEHDAGVPLRGGAGGDDGGSVAVPLRLLAEAAREQSAVREAADPPSEALPEPAGGGGQADGPGGEAVGGRGPAAAGPAGGDHLQAGSAGVDDGGEGGGQGVHQEGGPAPGDLIALSRTGALHIVEEVSHGRVWLWCGRKRDVSDRFPEAHPDSLECATCLSKRRSSRLLKAPGGVPRNPRHRTVRTAHGTTHDMNESGHLECGRFVRTEGDSNAPARWCVVEPADGEPTTCQRCLQVRVRNLPLPGLTDAGSLEDGDRILLNPDGKAHGFQVVQGSGYLCRGTWCGKNLFHGRKVQRTDREVDCQSCLWRMRMKKREGVEG